MCLSRGPYLIHFHILHRSKVVWFTRVGFPKARLSEHWHWTRPPHFYFLITLKFASGHRKRRGTFRGRLTPFLQLREHNLCPSIAYNCERINFIYVLRDKLVICYIVVRGNFAGSFFLSFCFPTSMRWRVCASACSSPMSPAEPSTPGGSFWQYENPNSLYSLPTEH